MTGIAKIGMPAEITIPTVLRQNVTAVFVAKIGTSNMFATSFKMRLNMLTYTVTIALITITTQMSAENMTQQHFNQVSAVHVDLIKYATNLSHSGT